MIEFVLLLIIIYYIYNNNGTIKRQKESYCYGGGPYHIPCEVNKKDEAKKLLEDLDKKTYILLNHLYEKYPNSYRTINLLNRYKTESLRETHPEEINGGDTAYVYDKGEIFAMCLRDTNGEFHDPNLLMYVYLHELAHLAERDEQHTQNFWDTYMFLMDESFKIGIYVPIDYTREPVSYCGNILVDYNLYLDT